MFTRKIIPGLVTTIFCFSQIANASNAVKNDLAVVQFENQIESLQNESSLNEIEKNLDAMSVQYANEDASDNVELTPEAGVEQKSKRWTRVKNRWEGKLNSRVPHILSEANAKLDVPTETLQARITAQLKESEQNHNQKLVEYYTALNNTRADQLKSTIMDHNAKALTGGVDFLSTKIADHGGILPFLVHMKSDIQNAKLSLKAKKSGRSLASDEHSVLWNVLMYTLVIGVFLAGCAFAAAGADTTFGFLFPLALALGIDTLIIDTTGVGRKTDY